MTLTTNSTIDIETYIGEQLASPVFFQKFSAALKPTDTKWRYHAIYITDTDQPAWMDVNGIWRYADGSTV